MKDKNKLYSEFIETFLPEKKFDDYPLYMNKKHARWEELESDFCLWEQIEKDTSRTHAELSFFASPALPILIPYLTSPRREKFKLINGEDDEQYKNFLADKEMQRKTYRYDYMSRILYIYARFNPKIEYVQGMNEILAPIFYLVNAGRAVGAPIDEAACFFMFNNAITDIMELHIKDLDKSENGIYGKLNQINEMLVVIEPRIWSRLEKLKIDPFYYCFRWMTLLFSQ